MLKRIAGFDKQDWHHMRFLFVNMLKQLFLNFNWYEAKEAFIWMKIHLAYDSKKVD